MTADKTTPRPTANRYGLTPSELRAEILRCLNHGWQAWEIQVRFFFNKDR